MCGATVATTSSRALIAVCERLGMDTRALLEIAGLRAEQLADPDGRVTGERVAALWRAALERSDDELLPLRAAEELPFGAYKIVDFLASSAPTVGEGLHRVARYSALFGSMVELTIGQRAGRWHLTMIGAGDPLAVPGPFAEYCLTVTVLHCRYAAQVEWPLEEVSFACVAPSSTAMHERIFGCPVHFGRPANELVLSDETWRLRSRAPPSELVRVLDALAQRHIPRLGGRETVETRVMRLLSEELRGGDASVEQISRRLAMSARTLQRRLNAEGSSFASALERTRRMMVACYIKERGLTLSGVAFLLGFPEQAAFTRAFQRWYGESPKRYRATARPSAPDA